MSDKVQGGTPRGFESLCKTCRAAHIIRGLNLQEVVYCRQTNPMIRVTFPVESCGIYDDKRTPSLYQMEQIAWQVTSRNRGPVGFGHGGMEIEIMPPPPAPPGQPGALPPITGRKI